MTDDVKYFVSQNGNGIESMLGNEKVGEITFVRIGADKLIIDYTGVAPGFRNKNIGLTLVRNVADMARTQHMHIITLCPFARAMFNKYPEFDDIRLMNAH